MKHVSKKAKKGQIGFSKSQQQFRLDFLTAVRKFGGRDVLPKNFRLLRTVPT